MGCSLSFFGEGVCCLRAEWGVILKFGIRRIRLPPPGGKLGCYDTPCRVGYHPPGLVASCQIRRVVFCKGETSVVNRIFTISQVKRADAQVFEENLTHLLANVISAPTHKRVVLGGKSFFSVSRAMRADAQVFEENLTYLLANVISAPTHKRVTLGGKSDFRGTPLRVNTKGGMTAFRGESPSSVAEGDTFPPRGKAFEHSRDSSRTFTFGNVSHCFSCGVVVAVVW